MAEGVVSRSPFSLPLFPQSAFLPLMKGALLLSLLLVLLTSSPAHSAVYTEPQLDLMNGKLEKLKTDLHYPAVKDIFQHREYKPDFNHLSADADAWQLAPDTFKNEREARRAGAVCDYIKSTANKTALLKITFGQGVGFFVYDPDPSGQYHKTSVICPPTWYGIGLVLLVDVFGPGKPKFILIEHQGDHGTGVNERIHWLLGWHDDSFRTVFRETAFLDFGDLGANNAYSMNYKIVKGKNPRIEATFSLDAVYVTAEPYDFHSHWRDWFFWNEKDFSFYDPRIQDEKLELGSFEYNKYNFRLKIERNRKAVLKLPPLPPRMFDVDKYWKPIRPLGRIPRS
jgi:hypothetical protein